MQRPLTLILGGARSDKSSYAEELARASNRPVLFIATATAFDDEMRERIKRHQAARPAAWQTLEAPSNIAAALENKTWGGVVVLDCVTLLLNNIFLPLPEDVSFDDVMPKVREEIDALLAARERVGGDWLVISNEVGLGLVPPYPLGRTYRDALGRVNQILAQAADSVVLMVAGIPLKVK